MIIVESSCSGCTMCVAECYRKAIYTPGSNRYVIDEALCNDCADLFEVQCVRVCREGAIVRKVGENAIERIRVDHTPRFRAYNLIYFIAALSPKGFGRFEEQGWVKLREFIANAYLNPDTTIMFSTHFDDLCHGCGNRTNQSHVAQNAILDQKAMVRMGVQAGQVMRLWDAVRLAERRFDFEYLKEIELTEEYLNVIAAAGLFGAHP